MFTHMHPIKRERHEARGQSYEIVVFRVEETGAFRLFVTEGSFGVGPTYDASQEVVEDAKKSGAIDVIDELVRVAKGEIDRNEFRDR